jgi:glycosyltransferase involved in cell wall biosynthesis
MRLGFFANTIPFDDFTLEERPLGGTETGVVRLARALNGLGHEVIVCTSAPNPRLSNPLYVNIESIRDVGPLDAFIAIRDWKVLNLEVFAKTKMLWTGDSYDQPFTLGLGDKRVVDLVDRLLTVSDWHTESLCEKSGFPREKAFTLGNGIEQSLFQGSEERARKRLIYSSVPYRGLQLMPDILAALVEKHPDLELHCFSGFGVYGDLVHDNDKRNYADLLERLGKYEQFHTHGNVPQRQLAREMMRSSILAYPNTFEETSCITAMEAQAAGCVVVSSAKGAMPETVGNAGILLSQEPGTAAYTRAFVEAVDSVLSDFDLWKQMSDAALERAQDFGWPIVAQRLVDLIGK